jgi:RNA polymerase sigma-70 factor (ECF subfamily)
LDSAIERRLSAWMERAQAGDRQAYERLLTEVIPYLRRFIGSQLRCGDEVDDVVQDVLLSIHRDRHTYDPRRPFGAWMYAIARHRWIDWARRRQRRLAREEPGVALENAVGLEATSPEHAALATLRQAFARLSPMQREVIQLLKLEGWSVRQVSHSTGRTESAVKVSAHRGYQALRKLLAGASDDE